jgi:hypothetical protein
MVGHDIKSKNHERFTIYFFEAESYPMTPNWIISNHIIILMSMKKTLLMLLCSSVCLFALNDTVNAAFFWQLEQQLRLDYYGCTGDSTQLPVKSLIRWKHWNDSMTALPGYPSIAKAYKEETGKSAVSERFRFGGCRSGKKAL